MKKKFVLILLTFTCTGSNCELFTPQASPSATTQNPKVSSPNPAACQANQDCTIVPKHSVCCEMEPIAILKIFEATHLRRECPYQPMVCAYVSYQGLVAKCINSRCVVKKTDEL